MIRQVAKTIGRYRMFQPGERVAVAVSGGADSVGLLHVLREMADEFGIALAVAHLNHKLRGREADQDETFVRGLAEQLGFRSFTEVVDVRAEAEKAGENLEQVARKCRYRWFTQLLELDLADKIALGHTRSDQAETVLQRLLRGTGSAGLAGIRPVLSRGIVRPLIEVTRSQVREYLHTGRYRWREDSSNQSREFDRNRIRHDLMPQLIEQWNPNLPAVLARMAQWAQDEEEYWSSELDGLAAECLEPHAGAISFRVDALRAVPAAAANRLLRLAVEQVRGDLRGVDYDHIQSLRALVERKQGCGEVDLPGLRAVRSFNYIRLAPTSEHRPPSDYRIEVTQPGRYVIPGSPAVIALRLHDRHDRKQGYNEQGRGLLDWERIPKPLWARNWRAGDRFRPHGQGSSKKLKALFHEGKIAVWERAGWPVLTGAAGFPDGISGPETNTKEVVLWSRRFGASMDYAPGKDSRLVLEITEKKEKES